MILASNSLSHIYIFFNGCLKLIRLTQDCVINSSKNLFLSAQTPSAHVKFMSKKNKLKLRNNQYKCLVNRIRKQKSRRTRQLINDLVVAN